MNKIMPMKFTSIVGSRFFRVLTRAKGVPITIAGKDTALIMLLSTVCVCAVIRIKDVISFLYALV